MKYEIKHRLTGDTIVTTEIDCPETTPRSVKIGLAVKWAIARGISLRNADLEGADLEGAVLECADLEGVDLINAKLGGANLFRANLRNADMRDVDLSGGNLKRAWLPRADLSGANLDGATLRCAFMSGVDLCKAKLKGVDLFGADLPGAELAGTDLIDGGVRSDGYRFVGWVDKDGELQIRAGCRDFNLSAARAHWEATRGDTALGDETMAMVDHIETDAKARGLI